MNFEMVGMAEMEGIACTGRRVDDDNAVEDSLYTRSPILSTIRS